MNESELLAAAEVVGYGAVKYFDLKQHPTTNYVFSYDRMLDTKGSQYIMYVCIGTNRMIVNYLITLHRRYGCVSALRLRPLGFDSPKGFSYFFFVNTYIHTFILSLPPIGEG